MGVAELWEENVFFVPWKHGSVIRSDRLVNFSHFTVIFVPVFHLMELLFAVLVREMFTTERMNNCNFVLTYLF